eukprot:CAMPEP_0206452280 /NCGR_PEP_ID=MMETSP0324_2-20121206/19856_1 /ASSEMBLY_ACC=CAM_ASM_000836 /TAXON_ID=2866 /ORGANISM="Crypthecodinium cohnii, Strain Seligo" /LENGTH=663 /DNA_ID=CAMNT_0053922349 /DNA_START=57 /DNA_END=2048 /DNA_ORIENTATION=+
MAGRKKVSTAAALFAGAALFDVGLGCTIIAVGKDASAYGAPMVGHSEDSGPVANDIRLVRVPRRKWKKGSKRPLYNVNPNYPRIVDAERSPEYAPVDGQKSSEPLAYIDQVEETYGYWDTDYGVQNEMGVSIGESTCTAMTVGWPSNLPYGYNKAGIEELSKIAMERCDTARCAAQIMGDVAVELGFYSADSATPDAPAYIGSSECLTIADAKKSELWNFNVMTGKHNASAIWAAQRVPPNHVVAVGNAFTIRKMNLSDHENFLYSPNVTSLAEEMGWWSPKLEKSKDIFDFFYAYGWTPTKDATPVNAESIISAYSGRRMWRVFSLLSPKEGAKLDPERGNLPHTVDPYPSSVPAPKHSVTLKMVQDAYRDHYEGTPYDLTKGMAAGPHGNPNRGNPDLSVVGQWERALAMYRTSWSFVNIAKPNGRSVLWFGYDCPHGTVYLPFYGAATKGAPESYHSHSGTLAKFSFDVAWWPYAFINQWSENNFELINPVVLSKARRIEAKAMKLVEDWEKEASYFEHESPEGAMDMLTERSNRLAEETFKDWWAFAWSLVSKYRGMMIVHNDSAIGTEWQRYPAWWLESLDVGYTTWTKKGPYHGVPDMPKAIELSAVVDPSGLGSTATNAVPILVALLAVLGAYVLGRSHGHDLGARSDGDCYVSVA